MATFFENNFNMTKEQVRTMILMLVATVAIFAVRMAFASSGGSDLDDSLSDIWDELQALATGNAGRILMICMILGGIYFGLVNVNGVAFVMCVVSLLVLANVSDIIDGSLTASYDLLPAVMAKLPAVPAPGL
ncbi:conserved membrane hypothetical protein [Vibrio jasicida]|uniref:Pili assembly chaperone n=2 Tax=Vibrio TaxID=662 RepID=A0AAU9QRY4_9VIBR|nr:MULTISPECIES: hypothetical protein [Vibrio]PAW02343.1 hypothetical protein CKJ79_16915 [Vibrio coralliilyticus]POB47075.1 hypothetical protein CRN52_13435 [Vibrio vulnificus]CAH1589323.1 conserved membrane hypothetical protein [Vibrio jasicida]CAH1599600.1 conserved membrane hypothetical protein [Vibrio jasicida]